jgi:hypothetical protein
VWLPQSRASLRQLAKRGNRSDLLAILQPESANICRAADACLVREKIATSLLQTPDPAPKASARFANLL